MRLSKSRLRPTVARIMLTSDDFMIRFSTSRYMPTEMTITATMLRIIEAQ